MDRALVERARAGDHDAFAELAKASSDRLYAVASLILHDPERAKDAVQEALIAAWRGIRALREPDAWNAWLQRLVIRACYRLARTDRHRIVELRLAGANEPRMEDGSVSLADRDQLERGFRRLPADQRAILVVHYYLGLPLSETADVLGIPAGTAKSRLNRATRAMRAALEADAREAIVAKERPA
jgi:RNA polymerase sigma factor (sigma-70 family)